MHLEPAAGDSVAEEVERREGNPLSRDSRANPSSRRVAAYRSCSRGSGPAQTSADVAVGPVGEDPAGAEDEVGPEAVAVLAMDWRSSSPQESARMGRLKSRMSFPAPTT